MTQIIISNYIFTFMMLLKEDSYRIPNNLKI